MTDPSVEKWMKYAEDDYKAAKHIYDTYYPRLYEIICNHCQQSAEKAIKAVILSSGISGGIPKSHDLEFLLNQIKYKYDVSNELLDHADSLTVYGITARYPNELNLEDRDARNALKVAKEILDWCMAQMSVDPDQDAL